jgi:hypothetical protein
MVGGRGERGEGRMGKAAVSAQAAAAAFIAVTISASQLHLRLLLCAAPCALVAAWAARLQNATACPLVARPPTLLPHSQSCSPGGIC